MLNDNTKETLCRVASDVFEQTAFMFSEPPDRDNLEKLAKSQGVEISISFRGPTKGTITAIMPVELCTLLANNIAGEEVESIELKVPSEDGSGDQDTDQTEKLNVLSDAGKEIVNIIAGRLLTDLYGETDVFDLTAPTVRICPDDEFFYIASSDDAACLVIEEFPVVLTFMERKKVNEY